ncbi:MAG: hypothetical protein HW419_2998 [Deltaproteobacteria bacterium]|nr:hypothetical protein [Deltaproteobacteria bacterium]
MDLDPIKQLQSLLDDRSKVLEKISSIHSILGSVKPTESGAPAPATPTAGTTSEQTSAEFAYSRLQRALHDMQKQIEQRMQPLARQIVESEVARLREQSGHDQTALNECLAQINQCILACIDRMDQYQKRYNVLTGLNQRLERLGAPSEPVPEYLPAQDFSDTIQSRVNLLRHQAKL